MLLVVMLTIPLLLLVLSYLANRLRAQKFWLLLAAVEAVTVAVVAEQAALTTLVIKL
jgi:hypothetical protein